VNTIYLTTSEEDIKKAAEIIKRGGLVAFPTETVYGLGGNALDSKAAKAIYAAKGRPSDNPLIAHISDISEIETIANGFNDNARKLAEAIWPGPMTMVLPKKAVVPDETTGGLNTVAIRCPADEAARHLIKYSGVPIAAPSANTSGRPSPTLWQHVKEDLDGKVDAIIMGSRCIGGIESTIVDMTGELPMILRPGLITPERITEVLGLPCDYDPAIKGPADPNMIPKAPGMKYKHYAPKAKMKLYAGNRDKALEVMRKEQETLEAKGLNVVSIAYENGEEAARNLFGDLRAADEHGEDYILCYALSPEDSINYSVMNRMLKSAGYDITEV